MDDRDWGHTTPYVNQPSRPPTKPPAVSGTENEYMPKGSEGDVHAAWE